MARPLYLGHDQAETSRAPAGGHRGLWYDRFFHGYPDNWDPKTHKEAWAAAKTAWIHSITGRVGDAKMCQAATQRIANLCTALHGQTQIYAATWHFATGLGNPHPVENGFLWHPTLGMPYIQGSAVKGLVRSWMEAWAEGPELSEHAKWATLYRWFGSEDKDPDQRTVARSHGFIPPSLGEKLDTEAGSFIFFDALPIEPVILRADVMTPHMGKWYEQGGEIANISESAKLPADWHDPVPVQFLVADRPKLQFAIAPRTLQARAEMGQVMEALANALEWLGVGAKTAVGYGVMQPIVDPAHAPKVIEIWPNMRLIYTPYNKLISTHQSPQRAASLPGKKDEWLPGLSNAATERLKDGNFTATVTVEQCGNGWTIVAIKQNL